MKSKTSSICKVVSGAALVVTIIMCIISDTFTEQLWIAIFGLLIALVFMSLAIIIDKIIQTTKEQKRIYDSIDALSEKINIMLGLDKTTVAIENLKAETPFIYADANNPAITKEEDLTWVCPDCGNLELTVNTVCTKCGYDRNQH
ncbi:MAG: hypothetical protein IJB70_09825 [Clostridia bacterium]|nr:hypothetical protein [Clostridia bacterium]